MKEAQNGYFTDLADVFSKIQVTDHNHHPIELHAGAEKVVELIDSCNKQGCKLMFIGNGGSAAIASHQSIDFWKNGGVRAVAFNDSSLLTCISNDFGYRHVFEKPIEMFASEGDVLIAISSSGKSENILRGVEAAKKKDCSVITFSGFASDNPLRTGGDYNFYVPSNSYGHVEVTHLALCHCLVDLIVERASIQVVSKG